ncbi:MAG: YitT family protein [Deltaproteobacteria bacterium]|nr:MAG: YitT family protein [Deltaproteobacteria bacterium]
MQVITLARRFDIKKAITDWRPVLSNLGLISVGSIIFVIGMNSVLIPGKLLSGGLVGIAMIIHYLFPPLDVGLVYFLLNIPLVLLGCFNISRRFMLYTIFGMAFFSLTAVSIKPPVATLSDPILSALFASVICGTGAGLILRSLGSAGGLDIVAVYVNKKFGFRPGFVIFFVNASVLLAGAYFFGLQIALYSIIYVYTSSQIIDAVLTGFNRRKSMMIISDRSEQIVENIYSRVNRGVTLFKAKGGYTGKEKNVIFSVTTLTELPKMKQLVYETDPEAFVVINDTLEVFGKRHGTRRVY